MPYEGMKTAPPPPKPPRAAPERKASGKVKAREEAANGIGQIIAFGAMTTGNLADAGAVGMHWPGISHEVAMIAETHAPTANILDKLLEVGPFGNLIVLTLPFVAQLLVNHKVVPPEAMAGAGVVHPDALTAQVKTDMARTAMQAYRAQQEAEAEMRAMQEEMARAQQDPGNATGDE